MIRAGPSNICTRGSEELNVRVVLGAKRGCVDGGDRKPASRMRLWKAKIPLVGRAGPSNTTGCGSGAGPTRGRDEVKLCDGAEDADAELDAYLFRIYLLDSAKVEGASNMSKIGWRMISCGSPVKLEADKAVAWLTADEWTSLVACAARQAEGIARERLIV